MQLIVIMIGLLIHIVCFTRLLENKQKYGADEITWKGLKEYLGSAYKWSFAGCCRAVLNRNGIQLECVYSTLLNNNKLN